MSNDSFSATIVVDQTPEEVFAAVIDVRGWWSQDIEGPTDLAGGEFIYRNDPMHHCTMRVTELVPYEKVEWLCLDNYFSFTQDETEWVGSRVVFDISGTGNGAQLRFTHVGLVPDDECFEVCVNAWGGYISGSLRGLIATGAGSPNVAATKAS